MTALYINGLWVGALLAKEEQKPSLDQAGSEAAIGAVVEHEIKQEPLPGEALTAAQAASDAGPEHEFKQEPPPGPEELGACLQTVDEAKFDVTQKQPAAGAEDGRPEKEPAQSGGADSVLRACTVKLECISIYELLHACTVCHKTFLHEASLETHGCAQEAVDETKFVVTEEQLAAGAEDGRPEKEPVWNGGADSVIRSCTVKLECISIEELLHACTICHKTFLQEASLETHGCAQGDSEISNLNNRVISGTTCSSTKIYVCDNCEEKFEFKSDLVRHLKINIEEPYMCKICEKLFINICALHDHVRVHLTCDICQIVFKKLSHLNTHKKVHSQEIHLNSHKLIHSGAKCYPSDVRNKDSKRKTKLWPHMRMHSRIKPYACDICNKAFYRRSVLAQHMTIHSGKTPYSCDICMKVFKYHHNLTGHMNIHSKKLYSCETCNRWFRYKSQLTKHMLTHPRLNPDSRYIRQNKVIAEEPFCDIRYEKISQRSAVTQRKQGHAVDKPHSVNICKQTFSKISSLNRHKLVQRQQDSSFPAGNKQNHKKLVDEVETDLVDFEFVYVEQGNQEETSVQAGNKLEDVILECERESAAQVEYELDNVEVDHIERENEDKGFTLSEHDLDNIGWENEERSFIAETEMNHVERGNKVYNCQPESRRTAGDICNKTFGKRLYLVKLKLIQSETKPNSCDVCKKAFRFRSNLISHMRIHSGEKPFSCNICKRAFSQRVHLTEHKRIHKGDYPYSEICKKQIRERGSFISHVQLHHGHNPYFCDHCKKAFSTRSHIIKHMRSHTEAKVYLCEICGKQFEHPLTLSKHKMTHSQTYLDTVKRGNKEGKSQPDNTPLACDIYKQEFRYSSVLNQHMQVHSGEKPSCSDLQEDSYLLVNKKLDDIEQADNEESSVIAELELDNVEQENLKSYPFQDENKMDHFIGVNEKESLTREERELNHIQLRDTRNSSLLLDNELGHIEQGDEEGSSAFGESELDYVENENEEDSYYQDENKLNHIKNRNIEESSTRPECNLDRVGQGYQENSSLLEEHETNTLKEGNEENHAKHGNQEDTCFQRENERDHIDQGNKEVKLIHFAQAKQQEKSILDGNRLNHIEKEDEDKSSALADHDYIRVENKNSFSVKNKLDQVEQQNKEDISQPDGRLHAGDTFNKASEALAHLDKQKQIFTATKPHSYSICKKTFNFPSVLTLHMRFHSGEKPFSCDICKKAFSHRGHLTNHKRIHTGDYSYCCEICKKQIRERGSFISHVQLHHGQDPYFCDHCKKAFSTRSHIIKHMRSHTEAKVNLSEISGKQFEHPLTLSKHKMTHSRTMYRKTCDICNKTFHPSHINEHMRVHSGERPHSCDICQKAFSVRTNLLRHKLSHSGAKPHACDVCKKTFRLRHHLKSHILKIHLAETQLRNPSDLTNDKSMDFSENPDVKDSHQDEFVKKLISINNRLAENDVGLVERGKKDENPQPDGGPLACDICKQEFSCRSALTQHMQVHSGEKPSCCDLQEDSSLLVNDKLDDIEQADNEESSVIAKLELCDIEQENLKSNLFQDENEMDQFIRLNEKGSLAIEEIELNQIEIKDTNNGCMLPDNELGEGEKEGSSAFGESELDDVENVNEQDSHFQDGDKLNHMEHRNKEESSARLEYKLDHVGQGYQENSSLLEEHETNKLREGNEEIHAKHGNQEDTCFQAENALDHTDQGNKEVKLNHFVQAKQQENSILDGNRLNQIEKEDEDKSSALANQEYIRGENKNSFSVKNKLDQVEQENKEDISQPDLLLGSEEHNIRHDGGPLAGKLFSVAKQHLCDVCKKVFRQRCLLTKHMRVHSGERPYSCDICQKAFSLRTNLLRHKLSHSGAKPHACEVCKKAFMLRYDLKRHILGVHSGEKQLRNTSDLTNNKSMDSRLASSLTQHMSIHSGEIPFSCDHCKEAFSTRSRIIKHMRSHTGAKVNLSEISGKQFEHPLTLSKHKMTRSRTIYRKKTCDICKKTFHPSYINQHMRFHSGEKPYSCDICQKAFSLRTSLTRHKLSHSGAKPHACEVCKKRFMLSTYLKTHILMVHSGEKQLRTTSDLTNHKSMASRTMYRKTCDICNKTFHPFYINEHMRVHSGEKPFSCDICQKAFSGRSTLTRHKLSHSGAKPHACEVCKKRFMLSTYLKTHILMVHSGEKQLRTTSDLTNHKSMASSENVNVKVNQEKLGDGFVPSNYKLVGSEEDNTRHDGGPIAGKLFSVAKEHPCDVCKKVFRKRCLLTKHMLVHSGERPHSCDICQKAFSVRTNLLRHKLSHSGAKPHACDVCKKTFRLRQHLKCHILKIHLAETQLRNPSDLTNDKSMDFSENPDVKDSHQDKFVKKLISINNRLAENDVGLVERGKKDENPQPDGGPLACDICKQEFSCRSALTQHMQVHSGEKSSCCDLKKDSSLLVNDKLDDIEQADNEESSVIVELELCDIEQENLKSNLFQDENEMDQFIRLNEKGSLAIEEIELNQMEIKDTNNGCMLPDNELGEGEKEGSSAFGESELDDVENENEQDSHFQDGDKLNHMEHRNKEESSARLEYKLDHVGQGYQENSSLLEEHETNKLREGNEEIHAKHGNQEDTCFQAENALDHTDQGNKEVKLNHFVQAKQQENSILDGNRLNQIEKEDEDKSSALANQEYIRGENKNSFSVKNKLDQVEQENKEDISQHDLLLGSEEDNTRHDGGPIAGKLFSVAKEHPCDVCKKVFRKRCLLTKHMLVHSGERPHSCDICQKAFSVRTNLLRHKLSHSGAKPHACDVCKKTFRLRQHLTRHILKIHLAETQLRNTSDLTNHKSMDSSLASSLTQHMSINSGEIPFSCDHCKEAFSTRSRIIKHMRSHTEAKVNLSEISGKQFEHPLTLSKHKMTRSRTIYRKKTCDICNKTFHPFYINKHMRFHSGEKPYSCDICQKAFSLRTSLTRHKLSHGAKPHACEVCKKRFMLSYYLKRHILKVHSGEKQLRTTSDLTNHKSIASSENVNVKVNQEKLGDGFVPSNYKVVGSEEDNTRHDGGPIAGKLFSVAKEHPCDVCKKVFRKRCLLTKHMLVHSGERPHSCDICQKAFSQRASLLRHKLSHSGAKPHACDVCKKTFRLRQHLKRHILKIHLAETQLRNTSDLTNHKSMDSSLASSLTQHMSINSGEIPFSCDHCKEAFSTRSRIIKHMRSHTEAKVNLSEISGKQFEHPLTLSKHKITRCRTNYRKTCDICNKTFHHYYLKPHMLVHSGEKPFSCDVCQKAFTHRTALTVHMRVHSGERPHSCDICQKAFGVRASLTRHKLSHSGAKPHECEVCKKTFRRRQHLKRHILNIHLAETQLRNTSDLTNHKSMDSSLASSLTQHMSINSGEIPFSCDHCKEAFSTRSRIIKHMRSHTEAKVDLSEISGKQFEHPLTLSKHKMPRWRTNYRKTCDICNKTFHHYYLKPHMLVHSGEKPFSCDVCQKAFTHRTALTVHMRVHSGERPHSCDICQKAFGVRASLTRHKLSHSGAKPHACEVCKKTFMLRQTLKRHILDFHLAETQLRNPSDLTNHKSMDFSENPDVKDSHQDKFVKKLISINNRLAENDVGLVERGKKDENPQPDGGPLACDICKQEFSCRSALTQHMQVHSGEKPSCSDLQEDSSLLVNDKLDDIEQADNEESSVIAELELCYIEQENLKCNLFREENELDHFIRVNEKESLAREGRELNHIQLIDTENSSLLPTG